MNVAIQVIGSKYTSSTVITTNSSKIVVGPTFITNATGNNATSKGTVLQTTLFINSTATPGPVEILVDGSPVRYPFEIINPATKFVGTGDYTGKSGKFTLGDNTGINGNRTIAGTRKSVV